MDTVNNRQFLEFLNQNMHRNYPIQDTCVVETNGVYLPSSFLVDCRLYIPCKTGELGDVDDSRFFIASVVQYTSSVQVLIGYKPVDGTDDDAFVCACSSAIPLLTSAEPYPAHVSLTPAATIPNDTEDVSYAPLRGLSGELWIGSTANLSTLGSLQFTLDTAQLNPVCIVKQLIVTEVVTKLVVKDGSGDTITELTGDVTVQAGDGILASFSEGVLTFAVDEDWLDTQISNILADAGSPIRRINGMKPDDSGNFTISGLDCTDIKNVSGTHSLTVSNPCSKPCCSEDSGDLADIKDAQRSLQDKVDRISNELNTFINGINNVETRLPSLVASRE